MENVTFVALICCCILITTGTESIAIENCNDDKFIDIRRNTNNTIVCKGFNQSHTIEWSIQRQEKKTQVAMCYPSSNCTVHQPDLYAVERSPTQSRLFYQQHKVDIATMVFCESDLAGTKRTASCTLNVIDPAKLSSCTVEEDRDSGTVRGSCRFDHAYSYARGFHCNWYQEKDGMSRLFIGIITYDSVQESPGGWCTFTTTDLDREPGTYTYSINFYPGPGNFTVNVGNRATSSPDVSLPTTKDRVNYTSPKTQEENDLPMGAIVGGIVADVAVIILVVVVVVFVRRKRNQKPAGSAHGSSNDNATTNDDFEEHVTRVVFTSDGPDASQENDENTYAKPAGRPPNVEPEHVYTDLQSNTATTTNTTTPSDSIATTTGDLHNTTSNQHRGQGNNLDNVHHNPVYVNENQPGEKSSGVQQNPTYANDYPVTAQGYVDANRDSNPYYSEIKDTGIN